MLSAINRTYIVNKKWKEVQWRYTDSVRCTRGKHSQLTDQLLFGFRVVYKYQSELNVIDT